MSSILKALQRLEKDREGARDHEPALSGDLSQELTTPAEEPPAAGSGRARVWALLGAALLVTAGAAWLAAPRIAGWLAGDPPVVAAAVPETTSPQRERATPPQVAARPAPQRQPAAQRGPFGADRPARTAPSPAPAQAERSPAVVPPPTAPPAPSAEAPPAPSPAPDPAPTRVARTDPSAAPPPVAKQPAPAPPPVAEQSPPSPPPVAKEPAPKPPPVVEKPAPKPQAVAKTPAPAPPPVAEKPAPKPQPVAKKPAPAPPPVAREPAPKPTPPPAAKEPAPKPPVVASAGRAPEITVVRTSWHPSPARRSAQIQLPGASGPQVMHEGQVDGALRVQKIEPSGVVFTFQGREFRQAVGK